MVSSNLFEITSKRFQGTTVEVLGPGSPAYDEIIKRWSDAAEQKAGAIVLPTTTAEISQAVKLARELNVEFVASGGRHSVAAASSSEGGLVIDLRKMNLVTVDADAKTLLVGGGAVWRDVDEEAAKFDLCTVGGTVNHTGVGGLTLGGGFGWLTPRHGLTIDNLLRVTMVLADGSILTCSATENSDLFWAIRGAGPCFGIASDFLFQAFPIPPKVWAGKAVFTSDKLPQLVEYMNKFAKQAKGDHALNIAFGCSPDAGGQPVLIAFPLMFGTEIEGRKWFADFFAIGPVMEKMEEIPYQAVNGMMNDMMEHPARRTMGGATFTAPLDLNFVQSIFADFVEWTSQSIEQRGTLILWELMPNHQTAAVPLESTSFANRGDFYNVGLMMEWQDPAKDSQYRAWIRQMGEKLKEQGGANNKKGVGIYSNYVSPETRPTTRLFGPNQERLLELKKKYDPENCFNKWQNLSTLTS